MPFRVFGLMLLMLSPLGSAALRPWEFWVSGYSSTFGFFQTFRREGTWLKVHDM